MIARTHLVGFAAAWILGALAWSSAGLADEASAFQGTSLYVRSESIASTMSATRVRYVGWLAEQKPVRAAVTLGPWHVTEPLRGSPVHAERSSRIATD